MRSLGHRAVGAMIIGTAIMTLVPAGAAHANTFTFTIDDPVQSALVGKPCKTTFTLTTDTLMVPPVRWQSTTVCSA